MTFTKSQIADMRASLDRAMSTRELSNKVIDITEAAGIAVDGSVVSLVHAACKQHIGATDADERLLAEAENARVVADTLASEEALRRWYVNGCGEHNIDWHNDPDALEKATEIATYWMGPEGIEYARDRQAEALGWVTKAAANVGTANVGTDAAPIYLSVNLPEMSPTIVVQPAPHAPVGKKVISSGTDQYGDPTTIIETLPPDA